MSYNLSLSMQSVHSHANSVANDSKAGSRLLCPLSLVIAGAMAIIALLVCGMSLLRKGNSATQQTSLRSVGQPVTFAALGAGLTLSGCVLAYSLKKQRESSELCTSVEKLSREANERREQMRRFWQLIENAPDPILTLSLEGVITSLNRAAEAAIGRSREELLSRPFADIAHFEERNRVRELLHAAQCRKGSSLAELRILSNSGEPSSIEFTVAPEMDNNRIVGLVAIGRDLSGRRKFEETDAIAHVKKQHAQDVESLRKFAGGIGHEFSNYLSAILTHCQMARLDLTHGHPAIQGLDRINRITQHLANLVRQIPLFSSRQGVDRESVDLEPVVVKALGLLRSKLPSTICIDARLDAHCPRVLANTEQIHHALFNLGANGAHAMGKTGGRLGVTLEAVQVNQAMAARNADLRTGMYVRLSVADSGHGMDAETVNRIFDPFFTTKPAGESAGLGLTIVRGIVRQHQGAVSVTSEEGRGTVFDLYFPAESRPATQSPATNGAIVNS